MVDRQHLRYDRRSVPFQLYPPHLSSLRLSVFIALRVVNLLIKPPASLEERIAIFQLKARISVSNNIKIYITECNCSMFVLHFPLHPYRKIGSRPAKVAPRQGVPVLQISPLQQLVDPESERIYTIFFGGRD